MTRARQRKSKDAPAVSLGDASEKVIAAMLVPLGNVAAIWASHLWVRSASDPAVPAARVLRALVEALRSGDLAALEALAKPAKSYLAKRKAQAERAGDPEAWRFRDPCRDRTDDAAELLRTVELYLKRGVDAERLAARFVSAVSDPAMGALRAQLLEDGVPIGADRFVRHAELVGKCAVVFARMLKRDAIDPSKRDARSYVQRGLVAIGCKEGRADALFKFARQKNNRARARKRNTARPQQAHLH